MRTSTLALAIYASIMLFIASGEATAATCADLDGDGYAETCPPDANSDTQNSQDQGAVSPLTCRLHGMEPDGYGSCECRQGSHWDTEHNRCVTCSGGAVSNGYSCVCPQNSSWDSTQQQCVTCGQGRVSDGRGGCLCPSGSSWNSERQWCVACTGGSVSNGQGRCECRTGYFWSGASCSMCPLGSTSSWTGGCSCADGLYWDAAQQRCMSKCPAGTFWNSARQCQPIVAPSSLLDEQRKFDKDPQRFISEQRTQVALAQPAASAWPAEVTDSLRETRAPQWAKSPNSLSDLRPGDVVLVGPDDSPTASAIMKADRLARIATDLVNGRSVAEAYVNTPSREVSHVAVAVQPESGPIVFLDHTSCSNFKAEGCTKLLSIDAFRAKYGARPLYVARPVAPVHAGLLWALAEQAAKWKANDYGMFGQDVVCSERVGIAVARATGSEHLRRDFLPVDILPSDFLVDQHYHFVVKLLRP